jgi:hypothetical protein
VARWQASSSTFSRSRTFEAKDGPVSNHAWTPGFRLRLADEIAEWLSAEAVALLAASDVEQSPLAFADRGIRRVLPLGLEASRFGAAAHQVRTLTPIEDIETAKQAMFALERVARAHAAPELLIRAAHGVAACALSLELAEPRGAMRADAQLVSALVRLVTATVKVGVQPEAVVESLAGQPAGGGSHELG